MIQDAENGLTYLGDLVEHCLSYIMGFFLQFFPDPDAGVMAAINSWGDSITGKTLTFNYYYFVNMDLVAAVFNVAVGAIFAFAIYVFAKMAISVVHSIVEMIPFVE